MSLFTTSAGKGVKFPTPGARITGKVSQAPFEKQSTKFGTQDPDFWPNGDPKLQIVVPLTETDAPRESADDDGDRTLYVASGELKKAIAEAMRTAGAADILVGGTLTVVYTGDDPASKNPANPKKLYAAQYTQPTSPLAQPAATPAPAPAPAQADPWTQQAAQQQWAQPAATTAPIPAAPVAAPAPAVAAAAPAATTLAEFIGVTEDQFGKAKQLLALGTIDPNGIAAALGITPEQVASIAR